MQMKASTFKNMSHKILHHHRCHRIGPSFLPPRQAACDIFINHRGVDTKRTIAGLLYDHLSRLGHKPFLDSKNMQPGDKLFEKIDSAIKDCKIGVAVLSPRYCESYFCLHELALIMETKRRVIPIFCDVKPSELRVKDNGSCQPHELRRFSDAIQEAKYTTGLAFDSLNGNWSEFLTTATDAIVQNIKEVEGERSFKKSKYFVQNR